MRRRGASCARRRPHLPRSRRDQISCTVCRIFDVREPQRYRTGTVSAEELTAGIPAEHRQLKATAAPWKATADFHILDTFDNSPGTYAQKLARCTGLGIKEACCKQEVNSGMAAKGDPANVAPSKPKGTCGSFQVATVTADNACKVTKAAACTFSGSGAAGCVALPQGAPGACELATANSGKTKCPTTVSTCTFKGDKCNSKTCKNHAKDLQQCKFNQKVVMDMSVVAGGMMAKNGMKGSSTTQSLVHVIRCLPNKCGAADTVKLQMAVFEDMNQIYASNAQYKTMGLTVALKLELSGGCFNGNGSPSITNTNKAGGDSTSGAASAMVASASMLVAVAALFA